MIPARHGTATFVPAGQTIKIINTSGTQVVDTWAFALPKPETKEENKAQEKKDEASGEKKDEVKDEKSNAAQAKPKKNGMSLPSQEEAEKATEQGLQAGNDTGKDAKSKTAQKSTWSSYVPSVGWSSRNRNTKQETEQQKDSKTWASYFPSGKGYSNYVPKTASDTVSKFASTVNFHSGRGTLVANKSGSINATPTSPTSSSCSSFPRPQWEQQVGVVCYPHAEPLH